MAVETTQVLFKEFVNDGKVPVENFVVDKSKKLNPSDLKDGEIFVETLYLSVDPYMRTRMIKMEVCGGVGAEEQRCHTVADGNGCYHHRWSAAQAA